MHFPLSLCYFLLRDVTKPVSNISLFLLYLRMTDFGRFLRAVNQNVKNIEFYTFTLTVGQSFHSQYFHSLFQENLSYLLFNPVQGAGVKRGRGRLMQEFMHVSVMCGFSYAWRCLSGDMGERPLFFCSFRQKLCGWRNIFPVFAIWRLQVPEKYVILSM